jgi:hypothetical protein
LISDFLDFNTCTDIVLPVRSGRGGRPFKRYAGAQNGKSDFLTGRFREQKREAHLGRNRNPDKNPDVNNPGRRGVNSPSGGTTPGRRKMSDGRILGAVFSLCLI